METFIVEATKYSPYIELDSAQGILKITGNSYPENALELYHPLFLQIDAFFAEGTKKLDIELQIDYLNTSSSKMLIDLINKLSDYFEKGNQISAIWKYPEDDEDYREQCVMFFEDAPFPYQLIGLAY